MLSLLRKPLAFRSRVCHAAYPSPRCLSISVPKTRYRDSDHALESFYHNYLLKHHFPNGTAQRLTGGITDITTHTQHIEVKRWSCWKDAIGQLLVYNGDDPKKELRVYLFGPYSTIRKQHAVLHFSRLNIRVFDMFYDCNKKNIQIIEYHPDKFRPECADKKMLLL